jgi:hypothetical protein
MGCQQSAGSISILTVLPYHERSPAFYNPSNAPLYLATNASTPLGQEF